MGFTETLSAFAGVEVTYDWKSLKENMKKEKSK